MSFDSREERKIGAVLSVQIPGGEFITRQLREGDVVSIGSDDTSELRLSAQGISGTHCILTVEQGYVALRDCYSQTGTFVNDEKVQKVEIDRNCDIRIGSSTISLTIKNPRKPKDIGPSAPQATVRASGLLAENDEQVNSELNKLRALVLESRCEFQLASVDADSAADHLETHDDPSIFVDDVTEPGSETASRFASDDPHESPSQVTILRVELEKTTAENAVLKERLEKATSQKTVFESDPFQQEMIELLREEVVSLQNQLGQAHRVGLEDLHGQHALVEEPAPSQAENDRLAARLEELLQELAQRDEHVELLESLLHTAEDANQAEIDEREQLTKWLSEFEGRFSEKAVEWQSETQYLKQKIRLLESERSETQAAYEANETSIEAEALQRVIDSLRAQLVQVQEEMSSVQQTNFTLRRELKEAQNSTSREEEIRLACERAEIARMRHEVEKKRLELESTTKKGDLLDSGILSTAEIKLREIRLELKEATPKQTESQTLSGRISSLWTKLNS